MATRLQNQSLGIDFIDENPAIAAYQKGQKFDTDQRTAELDIQGKQIKNEFDTSANPTRLRKLGAETSSAETGADVEARTADDKVATSGANASIAGTNANVATQTAPFKIQDAESGARTNAANADVTVATVQPKIEMEGQRLRQQRGTAARTEMDNFHKSIDMLDQGNIEGAKQMAEATGQPIPDAVLNDSRVRGAVISAAKRAKDLYPDRPANQQAYISAQLGEIQQRIAAGQPNDRFTDYQMPPAAPEPVEDTTKSSYQWLPATRVNPDTGQPEQGYLKADRNSGDETFVSGTTLTGRNGGAGRDSVFQQRLKVGNSLYGEGTKEAADYANGRRQVTPGEAMRFGMQQAETELRNDPTIGNKFRNPTDRTAWKNNRAKEIATTISQSQTVAPPAAPASPPAPTKSGSGLPPPGSVTGTQTVDVPTDMAGAGTRASPFVASTQQHVDWFKNNAPPDAVIVINGQPYTRQ